HGVGGFLGAVLTGVFCYKWTYVEPPVGAEGLIASLNLADGEVFKQVRVQFIAAVLSAGLSFSFSLVLVKVVDLLFGFTADDREEIEGLDRIEHGETGFDLSLAATEASLPLPEPRAAIVPASSGLKRFQVIVDGIPQSDLIRVWSDMCQPDHAPAE